MDSAALYARYNIALSYLRLNQFEKSKSLYIETKEYNLSLNREVNPGAIEDLKELIEKDVMADKALIILKEIFEISD